MNETHIGIDNKLCVVIQGPATYWSLLKEVWVEHLESVIFSTWAGQESYFESSDRVVFSTPPSHPGVANLNYQVKSTLTGIKRAQDLGYERVLKIRSDMVPTHVDAFLSMFEPPYVWALASVPHEDTYFTDYFMCGDIRDMMNIWDIDPDQSWRYPEQAITHNINNHCINKLKLCAHMIHQHNDVYSYKYQSYCSSWLTHWGYSKI